MSIEILSKEDVLKTTLIMFVIKKIMTKDIAIVALFFLVCAGFFLRAYDVGSSSLWIDEGFTLMQVNAIQEYGYPLLDSGKTEWKDALLPYILSILPTNDVTWFRMISVLFGTASIALVYFLGRSVFGMRVAIIASGMMTFSYWHIAWSRQIRSYSLLIFFVLLGFVLLFHSQKIKRRFIFGMSLSSGILAMMSKFSGVFFLPVALWYETHKKYSEYIRKHRKLLVIMSAFILAPIVWLWRDILQTILGISPFGYLGFYTLGYFWKLFGIVFVFALMGGYVALKYHVEKRKEHQAMIAFFFLSLLMVSFFVYVNQKRYLLFVTPFLFLYGAFFLEYFSSLFKRNTIVLLTMILITISIDQMTTRSLFFIPRTFFALETYTPQPNFQQAYAVLGNVLQSGDKVISAYPFMDQLYLHRSDYAFSLSYTGKNSDLSVTSEHKEYYSGVPEILSITQIKKLSAESNVYIIVDDMALDRVSKKYIDFVQNNAELFWSDEIGSGQSIFIYHIQKVGFEAL
jgi:hypothetical protein